MITNIPVEKLHAHPNNPRRSLGDLGELTESIRARGVLQNLTVVPASPGFCTTCELFNGGLGKCTEGHDKVQRPPCPEWVSGRHYTVVIGHRRLEAARLAGLLVLPCSVSDMDLRSQVATMLIENLQRNDLTVFEQAQGFQFMLDLGDSVSEVAARTGFSESTVRRRVNLLVLDPVKFERSVERGATLEDYARLEQIKDVGLRNEVLDKIGTPNFAWTLENAVKSERRAENKAKVLPLIREFAKETSEKNAQSKFDFVSSLWFNDDKFVRPKDAGEVKYYFVDGKNSFSLYRERSKADAAPKSAGESERERRVASLKELFATAYKLRLDFVRQYRVGAKVKDKDAAQSVAQSALFFGGMFDKDVFRALYGIEKKFRESYEKAEKGELFAEAYARVVLESPESVGTMIVRGAYCRLEYAPLRCYDSYSGRFYDNGNDLGRLLRLYEALELLGYRLSDVERALLDGSHEAYAPAAASGGDGSGSADDDEDEDDWEDEDEDWEDEDDEDPDGDDGADGEQRCRVCGCTNEQACKTDDGPCCWIEVDLCSACVDPDGDGEDDGC